MTDQTVIAAVKIAGALEKQGIPTSEEARDFIAGIKASSDFQKDLKKIKAVLGAVAVAVIIKWLETLT